MLVGGEVGQRDNRLMNSAGKIPISITILYVLVDVVKFFFYLLSRVSIPEIGISLSFSLVPK